MRNVGCLVFLVIVVAISFYLWKKPAPSPPELSSPPPATPLNSEKLKEIATLIDHPKAEWLQALGEPDRDLPAGGTPPGDAGETDWEFDNVEMEVSWLQTRKGSLPWEVAFLHMIGEPEGSLFEMDLLAEFFGLFRTKGADSKGNYEWRRADGLVTAEYSKGAVLPDDVGLRIYIEKPGGEPLPWSQEERQKTPAENVSPKVQ